MQRCEVFCDDLQNDARRSMMRSVSRFVFLAALLAAAPALAQTHYFGVLEDLPLPGGFAERPGWSMSTEEGALTEVGAEGPGAVADLRGFYEQSLPALGWSASPQVDGSLAFVRGREYLTFAFAAPGAGRVTVRARLLVRSAPSNAD
jgi:hypothetical protein